MNKIVAYNVTFHLKRNFLSIQPEILWFLWDADPPFWIATLLRLTTWFFGTRMIPTKTSPSGALFRQIIPIISALAHGLLEVASCLVFLKNYYYSQFHCVIFTITLSQLAFVVYLILPECTSCTAMNVVMNAGDYMYNLLPALLRFSL